MTERITNNAASQLVTAIDAVDDPVTFTVVDASAFPADGDFRILIDSEYLLVTARAGDDLTADRAQEGSVIAAHAIDAEVAHIITAESLKNLIREYADLRMATTLALPPNTPIPLVDYPTGLIPLTAGIWIVQAYISITAYGAPPNFVVCYVTKNNVTTYEGVGTVVGQPAEIGVDAIFEAADGDTAEVVVMADGQTTDIDGVFGRVGVVKIGP